MKSTTIKFKTLAILLLLTLGFAGCDDDEKTNEQIKAKNVNISGCKTESIDAKAISTNSLLGKEETITLTATKSGWMRVEHKNFFCNCCAEQIIVKISSMDNVILIDEDEDDHSCNCVCPFDVSYEVGKLENTTYTLIIRKHGLEFFNEQIKYNKDINKSFTIE